MKRGRVVGGGNAAVALALALAGPRSRSSTLVHARPPRSDFRRCQPANQRALARDATRIAIHTDTVVHAIEPDRDVLAAGDRRCAIASSLVVCCLGSWLRELGIGIRELRGEPVSLGRRDRGV